MPSKKITAMPDLAGAQVPTDLITLVDLSEPVSTQNVKSTLNDAFAEITKNITDLSVQFGNGAAATVSAAGKGKLIYNDSTTSFQVSENGGAYENLLKGSGANQQVAYWTAADTLAGDTALVWDATNNRLGINVTVAASVTSLNVRADGSAIAQEWLPNTVIDTTRMQAQVTSSDLIFGSSSNHRFHLMSNNLIRLTVDTGGAVGINQQVPTAQLQVDAATTGTIGTIINNLVGTTVDIARFQVNLQNRFRFLNTGEVVVGLASTVDGKLTLASSGAAFTQSLQAGTAPAATNTFRWPNADPTAGQALTASAPAAGVVTLSWTTVGGGGSPSAPDGSIQFNNGGAFDGDAGLLWDTANQQMLVGGIALAAGDAPIDIVADGSAIAQQWRENGGAGRVQMQILTGGDAILGTTTVDPFFIVTQGLGRINVESGGAVGINRNSTVQAQLHVDAATALTRGLMVNGFAASSVDIATFQVNGSNRARITETGEIISGLASTLSGKLTFAASGGANTQSIQPADIPASTITYKLPTSDPSANQALIASAPVAGVSTLTWATVGAGTVTGSGVATRVAFWTSASGLGSNANLFWDNTNARLGVGTATPELPLDVVSDALAAAQQWRETGGGATRVQLLVPSGFGLFGTSTNDDMGFMANNTQFINLEATGGTVFGSIVPAQATIHVNALVNTDISFLANNASGSTTDIIRGQVGGSNRFRFLSTGEAILGLASTVTGKLTLSNASGATLTSISAGNAASTLNFIWPVVNPTAGQVLSASAPSGSNVTLSWTTDNGGTTINPTDNVMPVRTSATTFGDSNISLVAGVTAITSSNAAAFSVGAGGNTDPVLRVVGNIASQATGLAVTGRAAGAGVDLAVISSGTNEDIVLLGKGSGSVSFNQNGTVRVAVQANVLRIVSDWQLVWNSATSFGSGSNDTGLVRSAAGVIRATNASTGAGVFLAAQNGVTALGQIHSEPTGTGVIAYWGNQPSGTTVDLIRLHNNSSRKFLVSNTGKIVGQAGGVADYRTHGDLNNSTASTGNTSTGETDIATYAMPANMLVTNTDAVELWFYGTFTNNGNNKRVRLYIGSTVLFDTGTAAFGAAAFSSWSLRVLISRTGSSGQRCIAEWVSDETLLTAKATQTDSSEDLTTILTIKITGQGGATNDISGMGPMTRVSMAT